MRRDGKLLADIAEAQQLIAALEAELDAERSRRCATCRYLEFFDSHWCGHGNEAPVGAIYRSDRAGCTEWQPGLRVLVETHEELKAEAQQRIAALEAELAAAKHDLGDERELTAQLHLDIKNDWQRLEERKKETLLYYDKFMAVSRDLQAAKAILSDTERELTAERAAAKRRIGWLEGALRSLLNAQPRMENYWRLFEDAEEALNPPDSSATATLARLPTFDDPEIHAALAEIEGEVDDGEGT